MRSFLESISNFWKPHAGQLEFLMAQAKHKVLACGRRWGKTDACAAAVAAALQEREPTKHLLVAPTLDQARILFRRIVEFLEKLVDHGVSVIRPKTKETPYPVLAYGDHQVIARSGHVARSLRGNEATHIIVDEAAYVPEEVITDVLLPMLATTDG